MTDSETRRLLFLGTQGWIPTPQRETTCLAYEGGGTLFLFDAGTGLSRLLQEPAATMLRRARSVHLFLTHYHLDHVAGLAYLTGVIGERALTVHVPAAEVNGVDPSVGVPALVRPPFHPVPWEQHRLYSLRPLAAGFTEVAGVRVGMRAQRHSDTSVAYRVADHFVFATDTVADPATAAFATGVKVLVHEAWIDGVEEEDPEQTGFVQHTYTAHASARQAAELARDAGVDELCLIHLNPLFGEDYYRSMQRSAAGIFAATTVPGDLDVRTFGE